MSRAIVSRVMWVLAVVVVAALLINVSLAQVTKGKSRALTTRQLMAGLVKPNCGDLKKGLDAGPADDKAWDALAINAALLNEASFTLMDDGRCPDGTWATAASKTLRGGSADVLKAIEARDLEAAKTAFAAMTKACGSCHEAHKKKN